MKTSLPTARCITNNVQARPQSPKRSSQKLSTLYRCLLVALAFAFPAATADARTTVRFETSDDLLKFTQTGGNASFWTHDGGKQQITGADTINAGWLVYQTPFSSQATSISAGVEFRLDEPTLLTSFAYYSLALGVASSPNVSFTSPGAGNPVDAYAIQLRTDPRDTPAGYELNAGSWNAGVREINKMSSKQTLSFDQWYYLSLEATFDPVLKQYTLIGELYGIDSNGEYSSSPLLTLPEQIFSVPALSDTADHYFFFGVGGQAVKRGVSNVRMFTYDVIPEPGSTALLLGGAGLFLALYGRRRFRRL